jgi:hypothetical protein
MPATVRSQSGRSPGSGSGPRPKPKADAYVGLLLISLLAQIAGITFLYLDYSQYPDKKPPAATASQPAFKSTGAGGGAGDKPPPKPGGMGGNAGMAGMAGMAGNAGMGGNPPPNNK